MERPIIEQIETSDMSVRGGRARNRTPSNIPRDEIPSPTSISEEISAARSYGGRQRAQGPMHVILPEAGELPGNAVVEIREWCRKLSEQFSEVIDRCTREEFLSEQWWDLIDEAETISNTRETLLGYLRGT